MVHRSISLRKSQLALAVAGISLAAAGHAAERSGQVIEEVVVTAQKREQLASDIPISMSVLDSQSLADKRIQNFSDLSASTPALEVARGNSTNNPVITIRGVGSTDPWINNNPSVSSFSDGVYLPFGAYLSMPLFDLARVEILKGPQAGLYGRNAVAGAINFVSAKPGAGSPQYLDLSYGSYGELQAQGAVNASLTDSFHLRLAATLEQGGGYMERVGTNETGSAGFSRAPGVIPAIAATDSESDYGDKDIFATRLSAVWDVSDTVEVNLQLHHGNDDSEIVNSTSLNGDALGIFRPQDPKAEYLDYDNFEGRMDSEQSGASAEVIWQISDDYTLTSVSGIETLERDYSVGDFVPYRLAEPRYHEDLTSFSQEVRLAFDDGGDVYWLAGLNTTRDDIDYDRTLFSWDYLQGELKSRYTQEDESWSAFGQVDWQLSPEVLLSTGLRYTEEDKTYDGGSYENDPFGRSIVGVVYPHAAGDGLWDTSRYENDDLSGQMKLSWTGIEGTLIYGSVSKGFKSGGFDGSGIVEPVGFTPYGAEKLVAYEVGVKSKLLQDALTLSAAAFLYDYTDKQVLAILDLGGGLTEAITQNAASSEVKGLDLDLNYQLTDSISLDLSSTFLSSEITDWNSGDAAEAAARIGNDLPSTPSRDISAGINWEYSLADYRIDTSLSAVHGSSTYRDIENTESLKSEEYTLINARVNLLPLDRNWSAYLYGKNLADKAYVTSVRTLVGMEGAYHTKPRTVGVGIRWDF